MDRPTVRLTYDHYIVGCLSGLARNLANLGNKYGTGGMETQKTGWQMHVDGALAELALARWLGLPFDPLARSYHQQPDIYIYHVRSTHHPKGRLILRDCDHNDLSIYVLVRSHNAPTFELTGWITAAEARRVGKYARLDSSRPPATVVEDRQLWPVSDLPLPGPKEAINPTENSSEWPEFVAKMARSLLKSHETTGILVDSSMFPIAHN